MKKVSSKANPTYLDDEEKEIIEAAERGEFQRVKDFDTVKQLHKKAAKEMLKKRPISIRLPERDIERISSLAQRDGIPYQTLIASIVHRYADGTLKRVD